MKPSFLALSGPTASGKTSWAIQLHEALGWPIISFDSRQFYHELKIGVARPSDSELSRAPHFFVADRSVHSPLSSGSFAEEVWKIIDKNGLKRVILVGGSGLYLKALLNGFDNFPIVPAETRSKIEKQYNQFGKKWLHQKIQELDPEKFENIDQDNPQRMMRVLGILVSGKKPFSFWKNTSKKREYNILSIAPDWQRKELYDRINRRVDLMMDMGLFQEVQGLVNYRHLSPLQTVGYKELFQHLEGALSLDESVESIKQNTRRYAKRQLTWFRNQTPDAIWLKPEEDLLSSREIQFYLKSLESSSKT